MFWVVAEVVEDASSSVGDVGDEGWTMAKSRFEVRERAGLWRWEGFKCKGRFGEAEKG